LIIDGYLLNSCDVDTLCDAKKLNKKISKTLPTGNGNAKEKKKPCQHWSKKFTMGLKFSGPLELSVK
jgi:hypothetical protein